MREWLSGRASPCQGECREFESRFPLQYESRHKYGKNKKQRKSLCFLFLLKKWRISPFRVKLRYIEIVTLRFSPLFRRFAPYVSRFPLHRRNKAAFARDNLFQIVSLLFCLLLLFPEKFCDTFRERSGWTAFREFFYISNNSPPFAFNWTKRFLLSAWNFHTSKIVTRRSL